MPTFRVILIGSVGVGKTSLLMRLAEDCFHESYSSTVGVEFKSKVFDVTTKSGATRHPKLQVWDFAGCGKFAEIAKKRYEEAHAICFVYDCTAQDSFDEIESHWVKQVKANNDRHQHTVKCLVGNKSDLTDKRVVETSKAEAFAKSNEMHLFETSAKTANNVEELFRDIATRLTNMFEDEPDGALFSGMAFVADEKKRKGLCTMQ